MDTSKLKLLYHGRVVHCLEDTTLEILEDHLIGVDEQGLIVLSRPAKADIIEQAIAHGIQYIHPENKHAFLLPGFVDTHLHAPQYLYAGTALDVPLMEWLNKYTFPSESRIMRDPEGLGKRVYTTLVKRLIENGTTAAALYGTIGVEANLVLARVFDEAGVRALVGKVNADQHSPDTYIESTSESLESTRDFIQKMRAIYPTDTPTHLKLVAPCITPRFIPTCSKELLSGLGAMAKEENVDIQSHLSESSDEVAFTKSIWGDREDAEIFQEMGLLTSKALFAHCTHLTPQTLALINAHGSSISHCPLSNMYFSARAFPTREAMSSQAKVGLGSDIAGGYALGIQESMRWTVGMSRGREGRKHGDGILDAFAQAKQQPTDAKLEISWRKSLYLATLGGARAINRSDYLGNFAIGKSFDAQLIAPGESGSDVDLFDDVWHDAANQEMDFQLVLEKWWAVGGKADRRSLWVAGRQLRE